MAIQTRPTDGMLKSGERYELIAPDGTLVARFDSETDEFQIIYLATPGQKIEDGTVTFNSPDEVEMSRAMARLRTVSREWEIIRDEADVLDPDETPADDDDFEDEDDFADDDDFEDEDEDEDDILD